MLLCPNGHKIEWGDTLAPRRTEAIDIVDPDEAKAAGGRMFRVRDVWYSVLKNDKREVRVLLDAPTSNRG